MKVDVIFQMFQLYFIIEKLRPDVLTLFTTLYDHLVSRNLFSKSAMRQFGASGPERLDNIYVFVAPNDRCTQVAQSWESLNKSDCFILDLGNEIYVWCGPNSNPWERMSANEMGRSIRDDERAGKVKLPNSQKKLHSHSHSLPFEYWHFQNPENSQLSIKKNKTQQISSLLKFLNIQAIHIILSKRIY